LPRLFFALQPDADARRLLAAVAQEVAQSALGRAPRPENLHVTLAFLGEIGAERMADVAIIGTHAAAAVTPFTMALDHIGMFRRAGIAWLAPTTTPPSLARLFATLRDGLQAAGLRVEERAFHPHVTLARRCAKPLQERDAPRIEWRVDSLQLMASETRPDGPRYTELASWPLAQ